MINFTGLIFLLLAHYFTGRGLVKLFKIEMQPLALWAVSMFCGVALASFVPCIMQLLHIPITEQNVYIWLTLLAVIFSVPLILNIKQTKVVRLELPKLYELPFYIVFIGLAVTSVWRCYYYPPTPRDVLTGTELIAEYTVRERTMINSAFSVDLRLNDFVNNIFKSPYLTSLQVIYKLLVQPFGQLWLSVLFLSFTTWLFTIIRERVHPFIACVLLLIYFAVPDLFAYSYIILYDYSNMVFFFAGFYFLIKYMESLRINEVLWVALLFGFATYVRSETMLLAALTTPVIAFILYKRKVAIKTIALSAGIVVAGPLVFNFITSSIFVKNFIPVPFHISNYITHNFFDIPLLFTKLTEITTGLIFTPKGTEVFAHFYIFFLVVLAADLIWPRRFNNEAKMALWGIAIVYVGLALLGFLIPSNTLLNSTKRGLFKLLPLMIFYMANSGILQRLSEYLKRKEAGIKKEPAPKSAPVARPPQQKVKGKK